MGKRKNHSVKVLGALLVASVTLCFAVLGSATTGDMDQLPVSSRFECLNCHLDSQPTASSFELNAFGQDFLANDRLWDADLAQLDSDGDGCLNGVELGDSDGDGQPDVNVTAEMGNPGEVDECGGGALTDEVTWGALKALFDSN
jgi:hypothetical protein